MVKKYKRNCNYCGEYYEGYGKSFCSIKCASIFSPKGFKKGQKAKNWNGFKKGMTSWNKGINGKDFLKHFKEGKTWNKGLTKETDKRVKRGTENRKKTLNKYPEIRKNAGKKISKTRKRLFKKGNLKMSEESKRKFKEFSIRPKSENHKRKIGKSNKIAYQKIEISGEKNPFYGRHHTKESKRKIIKNRLNIKPNKPEKVLINLFQKHNLPYKYVGNGKIIIEGKNPDFINYNGQKKIIELFGDYWHSLPKSEQRDKKRLLGYTKYGYKTLVIWEHELKNPEDVINKIKDFNNI